MLAAPPASAAANYPSPLVLAVDVKTLSGEVGRTGAENAHNSHRHAAGPEGSKVH